MNLRQLSLLTLTLTLATPAVALSALTGEFNETGGHIGDWQLTCDNITTCRAVGYHHDDEQRQLVSLLIKREAGKSQAQGYVHLMSYTDDDHATPKAAPELIIGMQSHGQIKQVSNGIYQLSRAQLKAVLANGRQHSASHVELKADGKTWQLSTLGMQETLHKMDELQKGKKRAKYPILRDKPITATQLPTIALDSPQGQALKTLLQSDAQYVKNNESCDILGGSEEAAWLKKNDKDSFDVWQIDTDKHLVVGSCFSGAYNFGHGAWVVSADHQHLHQTVSLMVDGYDGKTNRLSSHFKGRGIGDCAMIDEWTWDGSHFVPTLSATTGQCKGFAGGAWLIPSQLMRVASDDNPFSEIW